MSRPTGGNQRARKSPDGPAGPSIIEAEGEGGARRKGGVDLQGLSRRRRARPQPPSSAGPHEGTWGAS
eukprot:8286206-Alexandrium_andersonii.AAC.1